jgi:hypothetical protein
MFLSRIVAFYEIFIYFKMSDWDRFAAQEYELLVAEESSDRG